MGNQARDEISNLQNIVQKQDALIALLWYKVFGLADQERFGRGELADFFHMKPNWYLNAMEYPNVYDTLCRDEDFPWGNHAEWLRL